MNKKEININEIKNKLIFNWKNDTSISKIINSFDLDKSIIQVCNGKYGPYIKLDKKNYKIGINNIISHLASAEIQKNKFNNIQSKGLKINMKHPTINKTITVENKNTRLNSIENVTKKCRECRLLLHVLLVIKLLGLKRSELLFFLGKFNFTRTSHSVMS